MTILVTGYNGQLGFDVVKEGHKRGLDIIGTTRQELDITDQDNVDRYIDRLRPEVVIHCAAYTAVDRAEEETEVSWQVNVEGTTYLAEAAERIGAKFMLISTDYVFEGTGEAPFNEDDHLAPIGQYGRTKAEAEKQVLRTINKSFIVRVSWVFGSNGNNFVKTMLKLGTARDTINVVNDQIGSPTYTADLAPVLLDMIDSEKYGIYHATNEGTCSWAEFAESIFQASQMNVLVHGIPTSEYPTPAKRPLNSRLSKAKLKTAGFSELPHWENALDRFLQELKLEVK